MTKDDMTFDLDFGEIQAITLKGDKGEAGVDGVDGKSAYEVWLEYGNTGTKADFFEALKGAKGDKGESGDIASQAIIDKMEKEIADLYLLSNATVTGTETVICGGLIVVSDYVSDLIDGSLARVETIYGYTRPSSTASSGYVDITIGGVACLRDTDGDNSYTVAEGSLLELPQAVELGLYDSLDMSSGVITRRGHTQVVNVGSREIVKCADEWQRDGWFSAYVLNPLEKKAARDDEIYAGAKRYTTDRIRGYNDDDNTWSSGMFAWYGADFTDETVKYALCGHSSYLFYCIISNADLGVSQDDTDEVKIEALRTWLTNNPPKVRYLVDESEATTETVEILDNKVQVWGDGALMAIGEQSSGGTYNTASAGAKIKATFAVVKGVEQ